MVLPRTPAEYQRHIAERLNWFEQLADKATSLDERINVTNLLLMEILKVSGGAQPIPPPYPQIPRILEFDLSDERVAPGKPFPVIGNTITAVTDGTLEGIGVRLDGPGNDLVLFSECNPYPYLPGFTGLFLQNTAQDGKTLKLYIGTAGATASVELTSVTFAINVTAGKIMLPIDVQSSYIIMPVDIQAQYINLAIDIVAQTIGNLSVDIAAMAVGAIDVDITALTVGNISVDISAQSLESLDFNIQAQAVVLNMKISDQAKGIMSITDWATQQADDLHLQGETEDLGAGEEATLITLTLTTTKEHWLYTVHISGTQNGLGRARANKTGGYDELAYGYFPANDGYIKYWLAPVKRRKDTGEGITEITVTVKNKGGDAGDFAATLDGLRVIDLTAGEQVYTSKANWDACASSSQIDTATSEGDVLLALQ